MFVPVSSAASKLKVTILISFQVKREIKHGLALEAAAATPSLGHSLPLARLCGEMKSIKVGARIEHGLGENQPARL